MIKTGREVFNLFLTTLKYAITVIFYLLYLPMKVLNIVLLVISLPVYVVSQTVSLITNILYLMFLVYILQVIFGFQMPPFLVDYISSTFSWLFPGFLLATPNAMDANMFAGLSKQQIADMLKKYKQ